MISRFVKSTIKKFQQFNRRLNQIPVEKVIADLNKIPILKGDSLFIHTALSPVGFIKGDLNQLIDYFLKRVGENGRIFMPSFSSNGYSSDYLKTKPTFDVINTKSQMGIITELFRKRSDVIRSIHPTHSVLVWGKDKIEFTKEHHLDVKPFGEKSPFYKFLELPNSKVLGLGLTIFPMTVFRVYETVNMQQYPLKVFLDEVFEINYINHLGETGKLKTLAHNPETSGLRRNMLFENQLISKGKLSKYKIGNSESHLLDTSDFYDFMAESAQNGNLPYLGYYKDYKKYNVDSKRLFKQLS